MMITEPHIDKRVPITRVEIAACLVTHGFPFVKTDPFILARNPVGNGISATFFVRGEIIDNGEKVFALDLEREWGATYSARDTVLWCKQAYDARAMFIKQFINGPETFRLTSSVPKIAVEGALDVAFLIAMGHTITGWDGVVAYFPERIRDIVPMRKRLLANPENNRAGWVALYLQNLAKILGWVKERKKETFATISDGDRRLILPDSSQESFKRMFLHHFYNK